MVYLYLMQIIAFSFIVLLTSNACYDYLNYEKSTLSLFAWLLSDLVGKSAGL
jgi:hypothetical protein